MLLLSFLNLKYFIMIQSYISQPLLAKPLQTNTGSTNSNADVSFFSPLSSTALTVSTNTPNGRNQVKT